MRIVIAFTLIAWLSSNGVAAERLPRNQPEAQGVSSSEIQAFVEAADRSMESLNSFMLVRHGNVVAEGWWAPYRPEARHSLYSLSKSFTSTAVGMAIGEGKLSLDDPVIKFFPDEAPKEPSHNLKSMRVSDLLRMNTGQDSEPPRKPDENWVKLFLSHPVPFKPGTHFLYNTPATYMQSAIVQKATGTKLIDYLRPRLFEPLGIEEPTWEESPQGISTGGYGLSVRTEDIAKFGQLYLQKGQWHGKQLVSPDWIIEATSRQTSNGSSPTSDWDQGYGYQFWRCRHGAYRGDGAFGQYCIVFPEQDAVVAITSGLRDMQAVLNLVWDKLLPALKPSPLAANDEARTKLETTLKGLTIRPQEGKATAKEIGKKYAFPQNDLKLESIKLESDAQSGETTLVMRTEGVDYRISCGRGDWKTSRGCWSVLKEQPIAASGAWTEDGLYTAKICFFETPFIVTLNLKFDGNELRYRAKSNLSFGFKDEVELTGTAGEVALNVPAAPVAGTSVANLASTGNASQATAGKGRAPHDFSKWEKEVAEYEEKDKTNPPPKGAALFVGSSTIRLWKTLAEDFPDNPVINRGIGGSEIVDSTFYADRIIFPYEPKQIFLRAGGNDVHAGGIPEVLADDFAEFVTKVHSRLPNAEILYIATNPAPSRWGEKDKNQQLNELIRARALQMPRVGYVDAYNFSIGPEGPIKRYFVQDMLHLNEEGYKVLAVRVRPFLSIGK
jgi:CubicO group peptidase (beta-lactamase class C family)/lysophospholipase L1-like esterase